MHTLSTRACPRAWRDDGHARVSNAVVPRRPRLYGCGGGEAMSSTIGVSVLFTDLVDSTASSARLGAAVADDLRRVHFGLLRESVAAHGGYEVKTLGDGIMVVFSGVGAALDTAIGMQRAVARHNAANEAVAVVRAHRYRSG